MDAPPPRARRPEALVAPLVTLAAVLLLLLLARCYDRLPIHPPPCGLKTTFGIPCVGCGGTRAMRALAGARLVEAVRFNPAVVLGVFASAVWAVVGFLRFRHGAVHPPLSAAEQNRRLVRTVLVVAAILVLNWIYLLLFLP